MHASPLIAIIDDDESVCRALKRLLASAAMDSEVFVSAEEFLAGCGTREPDCLVLDVQMPHMNGLDLQRKLARMGRQIPIVFITAFDDKLSIHQALRAGALAVLQKPLDAQLLLDSIEAALAHKAPLNGGMK